MNKHIIGFVIGFLLGSCPASLAAVSESDRQLLPFRNLLVNGGVENGLAGITVSGGTLTRTTTAANVGSGNAAFGWDSSSAGQTLTFATVTIPAGLYGQNAVLSCGFKGAGATHTLSVWDGTTATQPTSITSLSTYSKTVINFTAPSSGSISLRLTSVAADEPLIYGDDCIVGNADGYNVSQVSQASLYGAITVSGCAADWITSSATFANFATQTGCTYTTEGLALQPSTNIPAIKFASLPAGEYSIIVSGSLYGGTASTLSAWQFHDGTNATRDAVQGTSDATVYPTAGGVGAFSIKYTTAQSNVTLQMQGKVSGGGSIYVGQTTMPMTIKVYRYPTSAQIGYTPDTTAASWSGYHTAGGASWTRSNTAYGPLTPTGTAAIVQRTNTNFGTVATAGSNLPGITFTPAKVYKYDVCALVKGSVGTANARGAFKLTDGTTDIAHSEIREAANLYNTMPVCGQYQATNTNPITFEIQCKADSGACDILAGGTSDSSIEWSIKAINQQMPAPVILPDLRTEVRMDTYTAGSQFATTNTAVFRYSNTSQNTGTAFTAASSSSLGHTITLNEAGLYCADGNYLDQGVDGVFEITKNSIVIGTNTLCKKGGQAGAARNNNSCSACFTGAINDVIRALGSGATDQSSASSNPNGFIHIIKVGR